MIASNKIKLLITITLGVLTVGCGGGDNHDTDKHFTKLEGDTNASFEQRTTSNKPKEIDSLSQPYSIEQTPKNIILEKNIENNTIGNMNNIGNNTDSLDTNITPVDNMKVINTDVNNVNNIEQANSNNNDITNSNNNNPPKGEINPVLESNTN